MTLFPLVRALSQSEILSRIHELADVLENCVNGGASVSFLLPFSHHKACVFWQNVAKQVAEGNRILLIAQAEDGQLIGTVQLLVDSPENQRHRGEVAKLLVHERGRRQGVATALMTRLEHLAREWGKSMLVLDTATGSQAEIFYLRSDWQQAG